MNRESYVEFGFVLCPAFFQPAEIAAVLADAKEVFAVQMRRRGLLPATASTDDEAFVAAMFALFDNDLSVFTNCGKQAQHLISLHRLSLDDRIRAALESLGLAAPNISTRPVLYFNHPRLAQREVYWRLSLHQDWRSMQGSLDSVVVWLPLVDIDVGLGALEVIPGSHRWGLLAADLVDGYGHIQPDVVERHDLSALQPIEVRPGDALFFSSLLVHRSGTNAKDDAIRWSCHFRYNNLADPTFAERGFPHPYVYRPQADLITPDFPSLADIERVFGPEPRGH